MVSEPQGICKDCGRQMTKAQVYDPAPTGKHVWVCATCEYDRAHPKEKVIRELRTENERLTRQLRGGLTECHEAEQKLAKALGHYPELYPQASEVDDGTVCIGDHTIATIAHEAADMIDMLQVKVDTWVAKYRCPVCSVVGEPSFRHLPSCSRFQRRGG